MPLVHVNGITVFVSSDATLAFVDPEHVVARTRETYAFANACVVGSALWVQHHDKPESTLREVDVKTGACLSEAKGTPYARIALHLRTLALKGPIQALPKLRAHPALKHVRVDDIASTEAELLRAAGIEVLAH